MKDELQQYKKSGEILSTALDYALSITKPGEKLLDIAEKTEELIRKNSAQPAFPVNISINELAAHYSPVINDDLIIPKDSIVKIDAGVHVNGFITDAARTIIFNQKWKQMKDLARKALDKALETVKHGTSVFQIGEIVEKTITAEGYKPIVNLSGHSLAQFSLHDGISIPNYNVPKRTRDNKQIFRKGRAYAIEPFVTSGKGRVKDGRDMTIFRQFRKVNLDSLPKIVREGYKYIDEMFHQMPFSPRWLLKSDFSVEEIEIIMNNLLNRNIIYGYPILVEISRAPVTQAEETVYVGEDKIYILTKSKKE